MFSRDVAAAEIDAIREREHQATHHCSAYRLGAEGDDFRYIDFSTTSFLPP